MQHEPDLRQALPWIIAALIALVLSSQIAALEIGSIVRIKGSETSTLVGMGLVVGLDGTGDGGDFAPAHRPLVEVISRLMDDQTSLQELENSKSVALVAIEATVPAPGAREGDLLDVFVSCVGPAKSLAGGRLFLIPMVGEHVDSDVMALARGAVKLEDPDSPRTGKIENGAKMTRSVRARFMDQRGYIQLVVNEANASWTTTNNLAALINGLVSPDGPEAARAIDAKNVFIRVPDYERSNPASFIANILEAYIDGSQVTGSARVVVNERTGTIVMSGDVEISPTIISHDGLTITMLKPEPKPEPGEDLPPQIVTEDFLTLDPSNRGGARLEDLLTAFNQLKVPAEDRITIVKQMHEAGQLHAELVIQ
ncbi:MAG: flagellar basal body P-ring protein FlgI [Planctomycetota bacterium]